MILISLIGQGDWGGYDPIFWILPILFCMYSLQQSKKNRYPGKEKLIESWYTTLDIETVYNLTREEIEGWREKATKPLTSARSVIKSLRTPKDERTRFIIKEEKPPRLLRVKDSKDPMFFELSEVDEGGTVIRITYNNRHKAKIARFKASLPIRIPTVPMGTICQSCERSVLSEYIICPYCGDKIHKD
jgi:hypothetical protein